MAVGITISIDQNSQSIANNTSNVTVTVRASWTGGSYNKTQKSGWLKIDGTTYNFTSSFNTSRETEGDQELFSKTVNVSHNSNGTKTLACSASYTSGVSSGTVTTSASKVLTTIPRKSTLSVSNGTLGTQQTVKVTRQATSFKHTITYKCGTASGTVCTKSIDESIPWIPPLSLASQNTTGTTVSITLTITTYSGDIDVGSNTRTITCTIPSTVKPSCAVSVTDATGNLAKYGSFVKGLSKFKVVVTPTTSYGSAIKTYKTTANGATYTSASFETAVLASSGTLKVSATVTDKRNRSDTASVSIEVLNYTVPVISKLTVRRCNVAADGTVTYNDQGENIEVTFSASITSLNDINSASYVLKYKRPTDESFTEVNIDTSAYANKYSIVDGTYIFSADSGSSYNIEFDAIDSHNTTARTTTASTGFTLMHFNTAGDGIGIGKIAELTGTLDIGMRTRLYGGLLYPELEPETDLNDVYTPNTYIGNNTSSNNYANCPLASGTFTFEVLSAGDEGQVLQRLVKCSKTEPYVYERYYYQNAWGEWYGGWIYPTLSSKFAIYGSSINDHKPKYRKDGRLVEVRGVVAPTEVLEGGTVTHVIFTLPEGYRPDSPVYATCQGSGNCIWMLMVATNGEVTFSRYRNGDTSAAVVAKTDSAAGTWLPFHVTYFAK